MTPPPPSAREMRACRNKTTTEKGRMAVGAGQPHVEFRLGWSGLIAQAAESMGARLVIDELIASRRTVVCPLQLPEVERLPRAKNEILKKGSQTRSGGLRATRVDVQAA